MIEVEQEPATGLTREEVGRLYDAVGWTAYTRDLDLLVTALRGAHRVVTARDADGRLVGLARSISDGATIAYLQDVLVDPAVQRSGVGRRLVEALMGSYAGVRQQVLITDAEPGQRAFYESIGFTEVHDMQPALRAFVHFQG